MKRFSPLYHGAFAMAFAITCTASGLRAADSGAKSGEATTEPAPSGAQETRTFTSTTGQLIKGELLKVKDDSVMIKREDGMVFTLKANLFCQEDIEFFKAHGLKTSAPVPPLGKPNPGTDAASSEANAKLAGTKWTRALNGAVVDTVEFKAHGLWKENWRGKDFEGRWKIISETQVSVRRSDSKQWTYTIQNNGQVLVRSTDGFAWTLTK